MRIGATIHRYCKLRIDNPDAYITECRRMGFRAATAPDHHLGSAEELRAIRQAFAAADITIAEVGGWANCLDPRPEVRRQALTTTAEALAVADELAAACCITIAGSFDDQLAYGIHERNFREEAFAAVVDWVRRVLNDVKPQRAKLTIETTPWTPIDSADAYFRLLEAVGNDSLAVHLDPVNLVTDARTYFATPQLLNDCFDRFGPRIVACHAKDIRQRDPKTVQLEEVPPGTGVLDYRTFVRRAHELSPDMPMIIEHLHTEAEYASAADYIRSCL